MRKKRVNKIEVSNQNPESRRCIKNSSDSWLLTPEFWILDFFKKEQRKVVR
jgi:hypothetical protein